MVAKLLRHGLRQAVATAEAPTVRLLVAAACTALVHPLLSRTLGLAAPLCGTALSCGLPASLLQVLAVQPLAVFPLAPLLLCLALRLLRRLLCLTTAPFLSLQLLLGSVAAQAPKSLLRHQRTPASVRVEHVAKKISSAMS